MNTRPDRLLSVTGILTAVLWALTQVGADLWLNLPDTLGDPTRIQQSLLAHELAAWAIVIGSMALAVPLVLFGAAAQRALGNSTLAAAVLGGAVMLALAGIIRGIGKFALLSGAHHHDTASIHTLGYIDAVSWPILGAATGTFLIAMGLAGNRSHALPRWLANTTLVLGVLALVGPGALLFWLLAPFWFVAAALQLERDGKRGVAPVAGATAIASPAPN